MATTNPFDLLGDDDTDDLSQLIAAQKVAPAAAPKNPQPPASQAKHHPAQPKSTKQLPSKPTQTGRETRNEAGHGGGRGGGGRGYGRGRGGGGGGYRRDFGSDENSFSNSGFPTGQGTPEDGEAGKTSERRGGFGGPRGPYRGGRGGGFSNGDGGEGDRPRRMFERRSGTGHGNELKREGSGRGNWGSKTDEFSQVTEENNESEKILGNEKPVGDGEAADVDKESPTKEPEEKEPEDKEMTLEEYQKVLEEKRKALQALKTEERKVDVKEFESMQQLSNKKGNDDVFIKLGSDKDRKKEAAEKEEKAKKAVNITEFLKPTEGEKYYNPGGRGRGRGGRGSRGGYGGGGSSMRNVPAPSIEDPGEFPTLGAK